MNMLRMTSLVGVTILATFGAAEAAQAGFLVNQVEGSVLVQGEDGYSLAVAGQQVDEHHKILLKPNSALVLVGQTEDCFIHITKPGVYSLGTDTPCQSGQVSMLMPDFAIVPVSGSPHAHNTIATEHSYEPLIAGGAFVAGVTGMVIWQQLSQSSVSDH